MTYENEKQSLEIEAINYTLGCTIGRVFSVVVDAAGQNNLCFPVAELTNKPHGFWQQTTQ